MPISRLNHAVLFVRDADRAAEFYEDVLGFRRVMAMPNAVFMQAEGSNNDHDLGLFAVGDAAGPSTAGRQTVGLYHLAWEVETLEELEQLARRLGEAGAMTGASDHGSTKGVYGQDVDGNQFELTWLVPAELVERSESPTIRPLDFEAEKRRYGARTRGGVGITSRPAGATTD
jgi:catechol-2,3-dioxygenase